jgi:LysM repeat protein
MRLRRPPFIAVALLAGSLSGCDAIQGLFEPAPVTYEVVRGDTLFEIAQAHDVTVAELKQWNNLSSDRIEVGQILEIRDAEPPAPRTIGSVSARPAPRGAPSPAGTASEDSSGPRVPDLAMPPAKRCLGGPALDDLSADQGMVTAEGLGHDAVSQAMNAFLPNVSSCLAGLDANPSGALTLAISVGCDGRVTRVATESRDDWPADVSDCIVQTLHYAPFPAHALPDGDTFVYPLRMQ